MLSSVPSYDKMTNNPQFTNLPHLFGWEQDPTLSTDTTLVFNKKGDETSYIHIAFGENSVIRISVPLRGSPFQYMAKFNGEKNALPFLEAKLRHYADADKY